MRILFLIVGIVCVIAGVLFLLFAALNRHGYYNLLDGENDIYIRLRRRMIVSFAVGTVLAVIGIVCIIIYSVL